MLTLKTKHQQLSKRRIWRHSTHKNQDRFLGKKSCPTNEYPGRRPKSYATPYRNGTGSHVYHELWSIVQKPAVPVSSSGSSLPTLVEPLVNRHGLWPRLGLALRSGILNRAHCSEPGCDWVSTHWHASKRWDLGAFVHNRIHLSPVFCLFSDLPASSNSIPRVLTTSTPPLSPRCVQSLHWTGRDKIKWRLLRWSFFKILIKEKRRVWRSQSRCLCGMVWQPKRA